MELRYLLALPIVGVLAVGCGGDEVRPVDVLIQNVSVIPMDREQVLDGMDVAIARGSIVAVAPAGDVRFEGKTTIDGTGRFVIPGLWDMHVHPGREADLGLLLANGVTGARVMFGSSESLDWRDRITAKELVGPELVVGSPIFEGRPPPEFASVIDTVGRVMVATRDDGIRGVEEQAAAGYDFIKVYNNIPAVAYEGIVEAAARLDIPVAGHIPFEVGLDGALAAGQRSIEHLRGYVWHLVPDDAPQRPGPDLRSRTLSWEFSNPDQMAALASRTRSGGVWNVPTTTVRILLSTDDDIEQYLARPAAAFLPAGSLSFFRDRSQTAWLSNFTPDDFERATAGAGVQDELILALRDAGAGILAGTDISPWGFSLHRELENFVAAGLTPFEALEAATTSPARFFDREGVAGAVAPGMTADLVMLGANPLEDITATSRIEGVLKAGQWFDRSALDELLESARPE